MQKKWYRSSFLKGFLILLEHVSILVLTLSIIGTAILADRGVYPTDLGKKNYIQTNNFKDSVQQSIFDLLICLSSESTWQTLTQNAANNGVLDVGSADTSDYRFLYQNQSGFAYRIKDLIDWVENSNGRFDTSDSKIIVCQKTDDFFDYYTQQEFADALNTGELNLTVDPYIYASRSEAKDFLLKDIKNTDYLTMANENILSIEDKKGALKYRDFWIYNLTMLEEKYPPVNYDNLLDLVNHNEDWNGRLSDAYEDLIQLLEHLSCISSNRNNLTYFQKEECNLSYCFVDLTEKKVYSNLDGCDFNSYQKYLDEINLSQYRLSLSSSLALCESTFLSDYLDSLEHKAQELFPDQNFIFALSIQENFNVMDSLGRKAQQFIKYSQYLNYLIPAFILSALLFLTGLIWLTIVSGHNAKDEELHLLPFDHWLIEISAACVFLPWLLCFGIWLENVYYLGDEWETTISLIIAALFTTPLFLFGYLSLVRRIKAGLCWKNSILRLTLRGCIKLWKKCISFMKRCLAQLPSVLKTGLISGIFLILQFVLCAFIFDNNEIGLLLLFLIDCATIIFLLSRAEGWSRIQKGLKKIKDGEIQYQIPISHLLGDQKDIAENINHIGEGLDAAIENSLKNERTKTELITNVSHDIKTPLTSIINYVDLLKREEFTDEKVKSYLQIIDTKAHQLKVLTEDIVEASKASSGNLPLEMVELDYIEMIHQVMGEFQEKYEAKNLTMVSSFPETPVIIYADGRRMWRVLENIFGNVEKYALPGTRVYIDLKLSGPAASLTLKNISAQALNIPADELTERFIRGDLSRNTEGSGLGLSIAKSLVQLQGGTFQLYLDGDLFKVEITFSQK